MFFLVYQTGTRFQVQETTDVATVERLRQQRGKQAQLYVARDRKALNAAYPELAQATDVLDTDEGDA